MDPQPLLLAEAMQIEPVAAVVRDLDRFDLFFFRFAATGDLFGAERTVDSWLRDCGFGVGAMQAGAPRVVLAGGLDLPPWIHFPPAARKQLDGALVVVERSVIAILACDALRAAAAAMSR